MANMLVLAAALLTLSAMATAQNGGPGGCCIDFTGSILTSTCTESCLGEAACAGTQYISTGFDFPDCKESVVDGVFVGFTCDVAESNNVCNTGGAADPHFRGLDGTAFDFDGEQGKVFNLISESRHQFNSLFNRHAGPDAWPQAGTWMTAYGLKYAEALNVQLTMDTTQEYTVVPIEGSEQLRMLLPAGNASWSQFVKAEVNGEDFTDLLESGILREYADGSSIYFPDSKHQNDPTDGPVMVVTTPDMLLTLYLESEDAWHFDFTLELRSVVSTMHGVLGQTLDWTVDNSGKLVGEDSDYVVEDGLLGTATKYSLFGKGTKTRRMLGASSVVHTMRAGTLAELF